MGPKMRPARFKSRFKCQFYHLNHICLSFFICKMKIHFLSHRVIVKIQLKMLIIVPTIQDCVRITWDNVYNVFNMGLGT